MSHGWTSKPLGQIVTLQRGFDLPKRIRVDGEVPIISSSGPEDWHNEPIKIGPGLVTGRYGTIGKVFFVDGPYWPLNTTLFVSNFHGNDPRFCYYLLQRFDFAGQSGKTGVPGVNRNDLHAIEVLAPDNLPEQQAIAAALSDADGVVAGLERVIAKKRLIKQGAMQDLLTARRRLPGFSDEWSSMTLFEMADSNKKNFDDGDWIEAEHIAPSGIRLIQTGNVGIGEFLNSNRKYIFEESFSRLECKEVHPGDVLICRLAEPPGRACIVPDLGEGRMITSVDVTIFRPNRSTADRKLLTEFMSQSSWFARVDEASGGTTRKRIARSRLGRMTLLMPSPKEQKALSELFADMDAEIQALDSRLAKARAVKEGMMQTLLTGRVRLV